MAAEAPLWEQSKENAAPLERGRNVAVLERSLAAISSDEERREQERMIRHYERLVQPTEQADSGDDRASSVVVENDTDPLMHWLSYIQFHQQAFPADTHTQFLLLERCFRALCPVRKYANDQRFLRICCMYAEKTNRAPEIFNYLYRQKIGVYVAIFWVAWAFVAEKEKDFAFAEKIFDKGIRQKAQPIKYLLQRQKQFQRRMSRHWLNSANQHEDDDDDEENAVRSRGVLGGLSDDSIRRNDRSRSGPGASLGRRRPGIPNTATFIDRTARASAASRSSTNNLSGFAIHVDDAAAATSERESSLFLDNSFLPYNDRVLDREQDRLKENTLSTETWNERGSLSNTAAYTVPAPMPQRPGPAPFAVYVDEECAAKHEEEEKERLRQAEHHRQLRDDRKFRQREDGGVAEKLTNDPLRYIRNPEQLLTDQMSETALKQAPVASRERQTAKKGSSSRGFSIRLLKNSSGREQSFEEARMQGGFYKLVTSSQNLNLLAQRNSRSADDSYMSLEVDGSLDMVSMDGTQQSLGNERKQRASDLSSKGKLEAPTPRNASTASSTVNGSVAVGVSTVKEEQTINTQLALKELSIMFSSPAFAMTEEGRHLNNSGGLGPILNQSGVSEAASTTNYASSSVVGGGGNSVEYSNISQLIADVDTDSSFAAVDVENDGPRNPLPRTTASPAFDTMVLRPLTQDGQRDDGRLSCASTQRRAIEAATQEDPLRSLPETELCSDPGFQIYTDGGMSEKEATVSNSTQNSGAADIDEAPSVLSRGMRPSLETADVDIDFLNRPAPSENQDTSMADDDTATFSQIGDAVQPFLEHNVSDDDSESTDGPASAPHNRRLSEVSKSVDGCVLLPLHLCLISICFKSQNQP